MTPAVSVASVPTDVEAMEVGDEANHPLPLENRLMVEIGSVKAGRCAVDPDVMKRMGELLGMRISFQLYPSD